MPKDDFVVAMTTCRDEKEATLITRTVLEKRLAACVNIIEDVVSSYWWDGKIEEAEEVILLIKTKKSAVENLRKEILILHTHKTPEFIVLPIIDGGFKYLEWIDKEVK